MRRGMTAVLVLLAGAAPVRAADIADPFPPGGLPGPEVGPMPRYFPRAEGDDGVRGRPLPLRRQALRCRPRRAPVPTNAPDDPSYVGSAYGLGKPSYYGFTPPLGVDDPFGRPLLPFCP